MGKFREFVEEWKARKSGQRGLANQQRDRGIVRATRDITGITGINLARSYELLEKHNKEYVKSFDRQLPPSLHVSERDRLRAGDAIPLRERCLEDQPLSKTRESSMGDRLAEEAQRHLRDQE